jgi:hypothetical protein
MPTMIGHPRRKGNIQDVPEKDNQVYTYIYL